jgi:hypothetical protein
MNDTRVAKFLLFTATLLPFAAGCTRQASIGSGSDGPNAATKQAADPWQVVVSELRKQTDLGTTRRVLTQLNADLTGHTSAATPESVSDANAARLAELLRLSPEEVREIRSTSYSGLDAAYLADALYLRDAAKSLDVQRLPAERQIAAAFAWVCRQVYLQPWELRNSEGGYSYGPPVPPTAILRRGYGTGLERAYVFLALLQQLGHDGCLIGPPGQEQANTQKIVDNKLWKGPFWAVGARVSDGILLFDPWRGEPLPGPDGKGVSTLAQLIQNPDLMKSWRENPTKPWDVPSGEVANATVYVTVPLSALSPRMKLLESQLATAVAVKLSAEPEALSERLRQTHSLVSLWAPPAEIEPFAYTRVLATFLPRSEGGLSTSDLQLQERLEQSAIPPTVFASAKGLTHPEAQIRLAQMSYATYHAALIAPGHRQRIHRGQFHDVSQALVEADKPFAAAEQRSRGHMNQGEAVQAWIDRANAVYKKLSAARVSGDRVEVQNAEAEIDAFWLREQGGTMLLTDRALAAAGRAEISYLMALCKHEQAERAQLRFEQAVAATGDKATAAIEKARAEAQRYWAAAKDAWERYAPYADKQDVVYPGRVEHAKKLSAQAALLAANPAANL